MPVCVFDHHSVSSGKRAATCHELDPDVVGAMVALEIEIDRGWTDLATPVIYLPTKVPGGVVVQKDEVRGSSAERSFDAFRTFLEVPGGGIIRDGAAASTICGQTP